MADEMKVRLEQADGSVTEVSCQRLAVVWQGRELWLQQGGNDQLLIGVDDEEGDVEYANLLLRPLASNLVSLQLEMEPVAADDEHVHGPDCGHAH